MTDKTVEDKLGEVSLKKRIVGVATSRSAGKLVGVSLKLEDGTTLRFEADGMEMRVLGPKKSLQG